MFDHNYKYTNESSITINLDSSTSIIGNSIVKYAINTNYHIPEPEPEPEREPEPEPESNLNQTQN